MHPEVFGASKKIIQMLDPTSFFIHFLSDFFLGKVFRAGEEEE